jgi:hypothetical protein
LSASVSIPTAATTFLRRKLIDDQKFNEVIVLADANATIENIRYLLRKYALDRSAFYEGRLRLFLLTAGTAFPSISMVSNLPSDSRY